MLQRIEAAETLQAIQPALKVLLALTMTGHGLAKIRMTHRQIAHKKTNPTAIWAGWLCGALVAHRSAAGSLTRRANG
jgi:hypothetical protein